SALSNALVQLRAHLTMRAQRAIQKCLSAATFVRPRRRAEFHTVSTGLTSPCAVILQQVEDVRPPRGRIVAPVAIHLPPRTRDRAPLRSTPSHQRIVSGAEVCVVAPMSRSRNFTRGRRRMDDSSYSVERLLRANPKFYVGLSVRIST